MSDRDELTALVHTYARLVDTGDVEGVVALFEHATWRSLPNGSVRRGADAIRPVYEQLLSTSGASPTKHLITNLTITVAPGSTDASSHCYWTVLALAPGGSIEIALSGQYTDTFARIDHRWRFTDRLITVDLTAQPTTAAP